MLLTSLLSLGALAVSANGLLVPFQFDDNKPHDLTIQSTSQKVTLDCSDCPFALKTERNGRREWKNQVPSDLEMEFDVKDNTLQFNGVSIMPVVKPGLPPTLTVTQKVKEGVESNEVEDVSDLMISYSLEMVKKPFQDGNKLVTVTMSILALDNEMVRVDDIEVKLIEDTAGNMLLHSATTVPASTNGADAQCSNVLCRVFAKFATSVAKVKASAKTAAHKVKNHCAKCLKCVLRMMRHKGKHANHGAGAIQRLPDGTIKVPTHIKSHPGAPHHKVHHHHHHHGGFLGRMAHVFWVTFKVAFVPILIGVAFGMAASAIGMLVGQAIVFLWLRYRRNDAGPTYVALPVDVKEEVPPPYEDVPTITVEDEKDVEAKA